jgi:Holliday junction DNA helicase RuvA
MIAYLTGKILFTTEKYLVLDVNGVGYKIICNSKNINPSENNISFFIHTVVREDAFELFGFKTETELALFEKLINISGIGPRSALAIVNVGSIEDLTKAINDGNLGYLNAVGGVGKKTAEKIILELRGKVSDILENESKDNELVMALKALGYNEKTANEMAKHATGNTMQEKIKNALKNSGK